MSLIVMKFGGSSVANKERLLNVARIITESSFAGNEVVAVVSAQGDTTDHLIEKAKEICEHPPKREMDMLLSTGEQISAALLSMTIDSLGYRAVSLTGFQAGFHTNSKHTMARIKHIDIERVQTELAYGNIVIITGFQGVDKKDDITTLGRGGSDTSAVAVAAALHADVCKIFTDVDGVYTADPRKIPGAVKLDEISFDEMLELASLGAQVLHNRSVELAQKYNVKLEVLSSLTGNPGTVVKEVVSMEGMIIKGVTKDTDFVSISVLEVPDRPGVAFKLFSLLGKKGINVDVILQSVERNEKRDIAFTIHKDDEMEALEILKESQAAFGFTDIEIDNNVAKVSIVGAGMLSHSGIASRMFGALYDAGINIKMITTSEIKISVIIDNKDTDRAVAAVHEEFVK